MERLHTHISDLEKKVEYWSCLSPEISKSSVGWHIEHTLLTTDVIIAAMEQSNLQDYKSKFSFGKLYVFTFNTIPRGRIESPKAVRPKDGFTKTSLNKHVEASYLVLKKLDTFTNNNYFEHPFFGHLNLKPAIKFLTIHTAHHLGIINDILKASKIEIQ